MQGRKGEEERLVRKESLSEFKIKKYLYGKAGEKPSVFPCLTGFHAVNAWNLATGIEEVYHEVEVKRFQWFLFPEFLMRILGFLPELNPDREIN